MEKVRCIYLITFKSTNIGYIGKTCDFRSRQLSHLNDLKRNAHCNPMLQNAYNKYGKDDVLFWDLEHCTKESEDERETFYLRMFKMHRMQRMANMTEGGKGKPSKQTDSVKRALSSRKKHKDFTLISPNGAEYTDKDIVSIRSFAKEIGMSPGNLGALLHGKMTQAKGWRLKGGRGKIKPKPNNTHVYKDCMLVSPDGVIYEVIKNLSAMSRSIGNSSANLHNVYSGKIAHYKGWTKL